MAKRNEDHGKLALDTLAEVARDPLAPPAARVQAARTLAEAAGVVGRHSDAPAKGRKAVAEMTLDELTDAATDG